MAYPELVIIAAGRGELSTSVVTVVDRPARAVRAK